MSFTAKGQTFNLTVNNGLGSDTYNEGDTIHVWSNAIFGDPVFVDWTGIGTSYLTFNNEWHTTYDVIPPSTQIDSTSYLLFGENLSIISNVMKETFYAIPPSPKGVVFLLHGTGGKGESFFTKYERYNLIKDLVFDGFAVFTFDANERAMGDQNGDGDIRWDNSNAGLANASNNIDIKNIETLKDSVIYDFNFPLNIPCFTLGTSAGAVFSDLCASSLNFNASAHITARGKTATYTRTDIAPVIWIMSENDQNQNANNAEAFNNYSTMSANQIAEWHLFKRSPVYPKRFMRSLNTISEAQSDSVFQSSATDRICRIG